MAMNSSPARKSPLLAILEFANSIITKDDDISIPCVLRTSNYIYYALALARLESWCTSTECRGTVYVKIVAEELLRCIKYSKCCPCICKRADKWFGRDHN